jgi:8-oxo-dGTP pyrophosphatase MutT (NUDIX family)
MMPLSTAPNAAIPVGFRKRPPAGDERISGAGILYVTEAGDGLFLKRQGGDAAGTWSIPAGKVEQDEEPCDAARRESIEEVGRLPAWELAPLMRETRDGVDFSTFGQKLPERFYPTLNDESAEYVWAPLDDPPQPLHPGLAALLAKFFEEESEEPEHKRSGAAGELEREFEAEDQTGANAVEAFESGIPQRGELEGSNAGPTLTTRDSALRLAIDRKSVRSFDEVGRMRVDMTNISKANICPYRGEEIPGWDEETKTHALGLDPDKIYMMLRDPDELAKSVRTWDGVQLLREHKPVSADDHQMWDIVGTTATNTNFADPYLRCGLVFWTADGIDLVESEEQREISCGYLYDPDMTPGVFHGEKYDGVMRNIRGNHVAIVEEGRAGPDVLVADSVAEIQWQMLAEALDTAWAA